MRLFEQIRQAALCHRRAGPGDEVAVPDLFGSCSSVEHRVGAVVLGEFGVRLSFGLAEAEDAFEEVDLNLHRAFVELQGTIRKVRNPRACMGSCMASACASAAVSALNTISPVAE